MQSDLHDPHHRVTARLTRMRRTLASWRAVYVPACFIWPQRGVAAQVPADLRITSAPGGQGARSCNLKRHSKTMG